MSGRPLQLAVFDLDGTLVDSQHAIVASMRAAFESQALTPPEAAVVRSVIGLPLDAAIERINPDVRGLLTQRIAEGYKNHAHSAQGASAGGPEPLMPGARAMLDRLETAGVLLAIATGKGRRGLISVLEAHGLANRFVSLQSADDAPGKPDPTMLRQAIGEAGAEVADTVMIGDTVFDLQMAHNAGVKSIAVSWGYHQVEHLKAAGPHAMIDHFDELDTVFNNLLGPATTEKVS
jgi:phosphoglycolate phosphatase